VNWVQDLNMLATKQTFLQNMVTIDGKGLKWPPVPGVWLGTVESPIGVSAAGDGRLGYSFAKRMQVHPLDYPSGTTGYYRSFTEGNFDLTRDLQIAFHPLTVAFNDGYAHTDYGPWSGETRLVESYQPWNPMEQAYRTVHLAKGAAPYVLVLDDLKKDDQSHLFEWNISLPPDSDLVETDAPETAFQAVEPTAKRESSFLIGTSATPRDAKSGRLVPKKGDPLLLVRVLWRNTSYGYPAPRFQRLRGHNGMDFQGKAGFAHLTVPAESVSPEFRILLYPHRHGDPLPVTTWNDDRTQLNVTIGKQQDTYRFASADGGRTAFTMARGDQTLTSGVAPGRPVALWSGATGARGERHDPADARSTRDDGAPFARRFLGRTQLSFERPQPPAVLRYTLDGSEPTAESPVYQGPLDLTATTTVKARRFDPTWTAGPQVSGTTTVIATRDEPLAGQPAAPAGSRGGLWSRIYEADTDLWDAKGFFRANLVMLPKLDGKTPSHSTVTTGVAVPHAGPTRPLIEQAKAFYRWTGWFHAAEAGVYTFAVDSCGPVTLDVGTRGVIDHTGVFHQQQAVRQGQVVLGAGWHAIDLVVTDPQFWNTMTAGLMPVGLTVARDDGPAAVPSADAFACAPTGTVAPAPAPVTKPGRTDLPALESGLTLATYVRDVAMTDPAFLDIDGLTPRRVEQVQDLEDNVRPGLVRVYEGWIQVTTAGLFTVDLPRRREGNAGLAELRAAYQNQLRIDGEVVAQHGVPGRLPLGQIRLEAGWHHLSLRLGSSPAQVNLTWPDGQVTDLKAAWWSRPRTVGLRPEGAPSQRQRYEVYGPTALSVIPGDLPAGAVVRLTRDGSDPTPASPAVTGKVTIDDSVVLTATAFVGDRAVTAPQRVAFVRVPLPQEGLLAAVDAGVWKTLNAANPAGIHDLAGGVQAIVPAGATIVDGVLRTAVVKAAAAGVDINLARGGAQQGLRLGGLKMPDNAITVALRVNSAGGRLLDRTGINAYGKGIKTISAKMDKNGVISAEPGKLRSPALTPGWHVIAFAVDSQQSILYVDGKEVARGIGMASFVTDSLDFLTEQAGDLAWVRLYDHVLDPADIAALTGAK
jgi:hypothetical protein